MYEAVELAGFAPFHHVLENTDHRGLFLDINLSEILDHNVITIKPIAQRRLQATIPSRVKKYWNHVQKCWRSQNIEERVNAIID